MERMLYIVSLLFLLASCDPVPTPEPDPEPVISFAASELTVSPEGGDASVKVTASGTWSVATDGQSWYTLAGPVQIYTGESILKISAEPNFTSAARSAILRFTSGDKSATLKLSQAFFVPELSFSQ